MRKIIFKVIKWILLALILILAVMVVWNYACKRNEAGKVKDAYGKSVEVAGKNMVVDIKGEENETTIILLPGWGSPSPVLEFLPLAEQLSEEYRVVTIEPFGYGLSDVAGTERNIDTIVEELHECVKESCCNQYYLGAFSFPVYILCTGLMYIRKRCKALSELTLLCQSNRMRSRFLLVW